MECEVKRREMDNSSATVLGVLEEQVKVASDKLLLTDFATCVSLCQHIVSATKRHEESDRDHDFDESFSGIKETATVLAIQALAEQGLWRDVIPFVDQVYGSVRNYPAKVIQMCILLHAHVHEYMVCHSLVNNWLDSDENINSPDSASIVKIYVANVLVPLGAYNLIPQIVESCPTLTPEERQSLLSPTPSPQKSSPGDGEERLRVTPSADMLGALTDPMSSKKDESEKAGKDILPTYMNLVRRLWRSVSRKGICRKVCRASRLLLFLSFAVLALLSLQTDVVTQFSRAMEVWKAAYQVWSKLWKTGQ